MRATTRQTNEGARRTTYRTSKGRIFAFLDEWPDHITAHIGKPSDTIVWGRRFEKAERAEAERLLMKYNPERMAI